MKIQFLGFLPFILLLAYTIGYSIDELKEFSTLEQFFMGLIAITLLAFIFGSLVWGLSGLILK